MIWYRVHDDLPSFKLPEVEDPPVFPNHASSNEDEANKEDDKTRTEKNVQRERNIYKFA